MHHFKVLISLILTIVTYEKKLEMDNAVSFCRTLDPDHRNLKANNYGVPHS